MVACDDNLDGMWLGGKPVYGSDEFVERARLGHVTSMDENFSFWEARLGVVSIRDADNRDRW